MNTPNDAVCIHCNANLTANDLATGWCDSCGKRLPGGAKTVKTAPAEAPVSQAAGGGKWALVLGGAVTLALLGAVAALAAAT